MPKQNPYKKAEYAKPNEKEEHEANTSVSDDISQILAGIKDGNAKGHYELRGDGKCWIEDEPAAEENIENTLDSEKLKEEIAKIDTELANLDKKSKQKDEHKADKELSD